MPTNKANKVKFGLKNVHYAMLTEADGGEVTYLSLIHIYMRTCPGRKCDKHIFLEWFKELRDNEGLYMLYIGYDPWHIDDSLLREFRAERCV